MRIGLDIALRDATLGLAWTDSARHQVSGEASGLGGAGSAVQLTLVQPF